MNKQIKLLNYKKTVCCIFIITLSILLSGCPKYENNVNCHYSFDLINNSNKSFYITLGTPAYHNSFKSALANKTNCWVDKNMRKPDLLFMTDCWESTFEQKHGLDTLIFYLIETDILEGRTEEEIKNNDLILQRYYFSFEDIKNLNFKITYPPSPDMKNIKMEPLYKVE
ncbi:MAG: hypothetical protein DBY16_01625 [Coprobacter sp.]|jgi:hypothetical protein|nr:hypothetical protein [Barnesiella sp. GGCC_0306]MBS7038411.1 hypothetical protein [Bacteroidales bacterium]PWM92988.1 MAG: hypothetical protein DBY16_01625 [Coprobacter sp.]